jgi:HlyD family secretion protein
MTSSDLDLRKISIRRHLIVGFAAVVLFAGGVLVWGTTTEISSAVLAPGVLMVESNTKKIQHPIGGVVAEIKVRNGDDVRGGAVLLRLDDTVTRANLNAIRKSMDELNARQARLRAEQDGLPMVRFPSELATRAHDSAVADLINEEARLFALRTTARNGEKSQLEKRLTQLREQIRGMSDQVTAKQREIDLVAQELKSLRELRQKNLVTATRVTALEREAARIDGERSHLVASISQTMAKITEIDQQIIQIDQDLRSQVGKELAEIRGKLAELAEKRVAAEDQLKRIDIRAPLEGTVHQMAIHTVGGVVSPGEVLMQIVPKSDALIVEAKVAPQDIDQVHAGQQTLLRFTGFNQSTTPELVGEVRLVSADSTRDEKTGASFYTIRIGLSEREITRLGRLKLMPGMPVETFIQTGQRTVISYLTKPLRDQIMKAWRER